MTQATGWSKELYESSISSRCWTYTPYDQGWDNCPELARDEKLRQFVELEQSIAAVQAWAIEIVERAINFPAFCPHCTFPQPYLEVLDAIGKEQAPTFVHGCYTAPRERKNRMQDYLFCLDAWLSRVSDEDAAKEIGKRGSQKVDWNKACQDIWRILGEHTKLKDLLVQRTLHRQRWWLKSLTWDDDARNVYCPDQYLGDAACEGDHYGNPAFRDPYFAELQVPSVRRMEERLAEICPDWKWFRAFIHDSWLCGPKAFRFLERLLWCIGKEKRCVSLPSHRMENGDEVPGFLQCEDTYPDSAKAKEWLRSFANGMSSWIAGGQPDGEVESDVHRRLGSRTQMKTWLAGLYLRKMELLNPYGAVPAGRA